MMQHILLHDHICILSTHLLLQICDLSGEILHSKHQTLVRIQQRGFSLSMLLALSFELYFELCFTLFRILPQSFLHTYGCGQNNNSMPGRNDDVRKGANAFAEWVALPLRQGLQLSDLEVYTRTPASKLPSTLT